MFSINVTQKLHELSFDKEKIHVLENKMVDKKCLSLQEEELLSEEVRFFPYLYDKTQKSYKEKDVVRNAWNSVAETLQESCGKW